MALFTVDPSSKRNIVHEQWMAHPAYAAAYERSTEQHRRRARFVVICFCIAFLAGMALLAFAPDSWWNTMAAAWRLK